MHQKRNFVIATGSLFILIACIGYAFYTMFKWCSPIVPISIGTDGPAAICVRLSASDEPRVGNPIQLKIDVTRRFASASKTELTTVRVKLPPEVELLDGDLEWQTDLSVTEKSTRILTIEVNQPGEWKIDVEAYSALGSWTSDSLYLLSSATVGYASEKQSPNNWSNQAHPEIAFNTPHDDERFSGVLTLSGPPRLDQEITVTYTFTTLIALQDVDITIVFPPLGFEVVSVTPTQSVSILETQVSWRGDLESNQSMSLMVTFKITDVGRGHVHASSFVYLAEGSFAPTASAVYLEVNEYTGSFTRIEIPDLPINFP